jgi:hypothetical protein
MPNEVLPNKREVMLALLAETSVFVHLDPRGQQVRVPPWFKNQPQLVLQVGLNMAVQIPDLDVSEHGVSCTLSFSRRPFFCSIPWAAVFGLVGENGPGLVWPEDVPAEIAAQVQAQTQSVQKVTPSKPAEGAGTGRESARARLRAVGSEAPPGSAAAASATSAAKPQALPAVQPKPLPVSVADATLATEVAPSDGNAAEQRDGAPAAVKPLPSQKPSTGARSGSKRELPPYLRVVK